MRRIALKKYAEIEGFSARRTQSGRHSHVRVGSLSPSRQGPILSQKWNKLEVLDEMRSLAMKSASSHNTTKSTRHHEHHHVDHNSEAKGSIPPAQQ